MRLRIWAVFGFLSFICDEIEPEFSQLSLLFSQPNLTTPFTRFWFCNFFESTTEGGRFSTKQTLCIIFAVQSPWFESFESSLDFFFFFFSSSSRSHLVCMCMCVCACVRTSIGDTCVMKLGNLQSFKNSSEASPSSQSHPNPFLQHCSCISMPCLPGLIASVHETRGYYTHSFHPFRNPPLCVVVAAHCQKPCTPVIPSYDLTKVFFLHFVRPTNVVWILEQEVVPLY